MKLSDLKIDPIKFEQGAWVDNIPQLGDIRLKVRGINNADWRRLQTRLIEAVPRAKRPNGRVDPGEMDRITTSCLVNTCLLDWDGLLDDEDQPLPYSKAAADKLLNDPAMRRFRDAVAWAAERVSDIDAEDRKEVVGN